MQLRQIPPPSSPAPNVENEDSSESDSELDYTDSDSTEFEFSEDEFLCDIAIISTNGLLSREHKSSQTEANTSFSLANVSPIEPYSSLDNHSIFESSSSSDSCPSRPLTPMPETLSPQPPKYFNPNLEVSPSIVANDIENNTVERRTTVVQRDRSPIVLNKLES